MFERIDLTTDFPHVSIQGATTFSQFKNELIKCIRLPKRSTFQIDDILGIKLITGLRLGFSHLGEQFSCQSNLHLWGRT